MIEIPKFGDHDKVWYQHVLLFGQFNNRKQVELQDIAKMYTHEAK